MNLPKARVLAFVKRVGLRFLKFTVVPSVSLQRQERRISVQFEILDNYSRKEIREISDPRSRVIRGHYFQPRNVYLLSDVTLEPKQGLIYTTQGDLIEDSTSWDTVLVYNTFPWKPGRWIRKISVNNAISITSNSFYHWLIEDLPSTIYLLNLYPMSPVVVAANHPPYVREFLKSVDRQVIELGDVAKFQSLLMIGKGKDSGWPHPKDISELRNYLPFADQLQTPNRYKKSYISRRNTSRSPSNEIEVEKLFKSFGFDVLILEDMTLAEQIRNISSSSVIAGIHGAGITNAIWLSPGSKVLDIVNENYWTESFHRLCSLCNVEYVPFLYAGDFQSTISISKLSLQIGELLR